MTEYSTLSSKGQLVIPKKMRDQANLQPGDRLMLDWQGDHLELRKEQHVEPSVQPGLVQELLGKYKVNDQDPQDSETRELRKNLYGKIDS